jgi:hypothetical protein
MDKPKKICIICKVYLIEVLKDVYKCPVCRTIVNERLDEKNKWQNIKAEK